MNNAYKRITRVYDNAQRIRQYVFKYTKVHYNIRAAAECTCGVLCSHLITAVHACVQLRVYFTLSSTSKMRFANDPVN